MKILFISSSYLPQVGGLEIFVASLSRHYLENNHTVKIITQKYPRTLPSKETIGGIAVERYLFFDPKPPLLKLRSIAAYVYTLLLCPINLMIFLFSIRQFNPDIINYHFVGVPTFFLLLYLRFFKSKLIVSLHGEDVKSLPHESKISMWLFRKILKRADVITANSMYTLKLALEIVPDINEKSKVIYNGINIEEFKGDRAFGHKRKYIFAIGRLCYKKGFDILINAFKLVTAQIDDIDLFIAGSGPDEARLREIITTSGLQGRVKLYGYTDRKTTAELFKGCEFVIVPSRHEAFGLIILEAMASGKIVIASRSGGPQEIIGHDIDGILVENGNIQALAQAILNVLGDAQLRPRLTRNLATKIADFTVAKKGKEFLDIYNQCCRT